VNEVVSLPYPNGNVWTAAAELAKRGFDLAYILPRSLRSALESASARIPKRIGFGGDLRRFLLTEAVSYDEKLLYAHRYLKLIGEEQLPLSQAQPYFPSEKPTDGVAAALAQRLQGQILGIAPISIAPSRTWAPERFAQVAAAFLKRTAGTVVLFGAPSERVRIEAIARQIGHESVINTAGHLDLPQLGWFISKCSAFVANDSGLMHVAACFKIPSVIAFGASEPARALPPWGRFTAIQHPEIFCVPCLRNHCVRFGDDHNACLKAITVTEIDSALTAAPGQP
jgi:heptosyltransferase-2